MEPTKNGWKAFIFYFFTFSLLVLGVYEEYVIWAEDRFAKVGMRLDKGHNHFGGPFKYLTIINMVSPSNLEPDFYCPGVSSSSCFKDARFCLLHLDHGQLAL